MEYIKREIEDIIQQSSGNFKAILVTGARQTGKSTLIKHLFPVRVYRLMIPLWKNRQK